MKNQITIQNYGVKGGGIGTFMLLEQFLCPELRSIIQKVPDRYKLTMEEIRLRINQPLMIFGDNRDYFVSKLGEVHSEELNSHRVSGKNIENTMQFISNYSIYAVEEELKRGYITIQGGHRIGIVGRVLYDGGGIRTIKNFSGLNIRISREKKGISTSVFKYLLDNRGEFMNTLIVSPPQCGKTTMLRDIVRSLSYGRGDYNFRGVKVGVVDERSELGACYLGVPQNDLGPRTDILDGCPKADGIMMLIRAMSPQVIATDEIGRREDSYAIEEALMAGIKLITTVHGNSLEDLYCKPVIGQLIKDKVFERVLILSNRPEVGTIEKIIDGRSLVNLIGSPLRNRKVT